MYLQPWGKVDFQQKPIIGYLGDGINTFDPKGFEIADSESTYCRNVSSRSHPALSTRPGRAGGTYNSVSTPNILGQFDNQYLLALDNTTWKQSTGGSFTNIQTGLASSSGKFTPYADGTKKYVILSNGTDNYSWDGTTATNLTNMPKTKYVATHRGRVYALNDRTLYFSALQKINDWTTANDAGQIVITNAKGPGIACVEYADHIIAFTEYSMHELYGTGPLNYQLVDVDGAKGCVGFKSVIELNGVLYFFWLDGVYKYTGGKPVKISHKLNYYFGLFNTSYRGLVCSWYVGNSVFWSMPINNSEVNNLTIEYDTLRDKWYIHNYAVVDATTLKNSTYGLNYDGSIYNMESGATDNGTAIAWEWISKVFTDNVVSQKKVISNLWIPMDLPAGSTLSIYISQSVDDNDWQLVNTFTPEANEKVERVIIPTTMLQNVDFYRIRFVGTGPCTIYKIEKDLRIKPR